MNVVLTIFDILAALVLALGALCWTRFGRAAAFDRGEDRRNVNVATWIVAIVSAAAVIYTVLR